MEWISIKDQMPELYGDDCYKQSELVLCVKRPFCPCRGDGAFIGLFFLYQDDGALKWGYLSEQESKQITHWMPLPQPPKE